MRFAVSPNHRFIRELVIALDRDGVSMAETWRQVGEAASRLGWRRPGYHLVRRLVRLERARRDARRETKKAATGAALAVGSPYVVRLLQGLDELDRARTREELVLQQHKEVFTTEPAPREVAAARGREADRHAGGVPGRSARPP